MRFLDDTALPLRMKEAIPALWPGDDGQRPVFLDAPSGTQMPELVLDAINSYVGSGMANRGGLFATSLATEDMLLVARAKVAALLGASRHQIVFGQNMTSLAFALAGSLARDWNSKDDRSRIVVSEIEHHANIDPWRLAAEDSGLGVDWIPVDPDRMRLDLSNLDTIITPQTRLVAIGLSSNAVGTVNDVAAIVARAREVGAISVIDAVHGLSHVPIDLDALGADALFFSAYKIFGPHIGVMAARDDLVERVRFNRLSPAPESGYGKAELGTQSMEAVAGLAAAMDFLGSFSPSEGALRTSITSAITRFAEYEERMTNIFLDGLSSLDGVRLARADQQTPTTSTIAFTVEGISVDDLARACARDSVYLTSGHFYARTLAERTGVLASGGWARVGISPYVDRADIERSITSIDRAIHDLRRSAL